jgi:hypothetical protein
MKQLYAIIILIFLFAGYAKSQETHGTQQSVTTQDEVNSSINIDIAKIKLPPLSIRKCTQHSKHRNSGKRETITKKIVS